MKNHKINFFFFLKYKVDEKKIKEEERIPILSFKKKKILGFTLIL